MGAAGQTDDEKKEASVLDYHQFVVCGTLFECPRYFEPIKPIGKGAYGVVCSAKDLKTGEKVAIKKITNAFENSTDSKRTLREILLLRHLKHENVIGLRDLLPPPITNSFEDVYVVYELMDTDLHQIIRSQQTLTDDHFSYFIYQVLRGLKYIHSAKILHRDLKPSNLLLNANCDLKICDFGLARTSKEREDMTEYVVTRWYRAPELLLSCFEYTSAIDIWSVGCILAELLGRKPLFPGKDYIHQLNLICKVVGTPTGKQLDFISNRKAKSYIQSLPKYKPANLSSLYPHANQQALELLQRMLVFSPASRITVEEALQHPYLASLHDINDEPVCELPFLQDLEGRDASPAHDRSLIWTGIRSFHPEMPLQFPTASAASDPKPRQPSADAKNPS